MRLAAEGWKENWQILIATMMSAQTRDEVTIPIAENLFLNYPSLERLAQAKYGDVLRIFKSLNYNKTKARYVIEAAKTLITLNSTPDNTDGLIKIPGVGRKTANVYLSEIGKSEIGIDTHVSYISKKLGWTKAKKQEDIEKDLKTLFPENYWMTLNSVLVKFGKTYTSRKKKDYILLEIKKIE